MAEFSEEIVLELLDHIDRLELALWSAYRTAADGTYPIEMQAIEQKYNEWARTESDARWFCSIALVRSICFAYTKHFEKQFSNLGNVEAVIEVTASMFTVKTSNGVEIAKFTAIKQILEHLRDLPNSINSDVYRAIADSLYRPTDVVYDDAPYYLSSKEELISIPSPEPSARLPPMYPSVRIGEMSITPYAHEYSAVDRDVAVLKVWKEMLGGSKL